MPTNSHLTPRLKRFSKLLKRKKLIILISAIFLISLTAFSISFIKSGSANSVKRYHSSNPGATVSDFKDYLKQKAESKEVKIDTEVVSKNIEKDLKNENNEIYSKALISPEGGALKAGKISVTFPAGAVDKPVLVTFRLLSPEKQSKDTYLARTYELKAKDLSGNEVSKFNKPLSITTEVNSGEIVNNETATYFFNTDKKDWEKLASTVSNNIVTAETTHFTTFTTASTSVQLNIALALIYIKDLVTDLTPCDNAVIDDSGDPVCFQYHDQMEWKPSAIGHQGTSLYAPNTFENYSIWEREHKNFSPDGEEIELFASIPYPDPSITLTKQAIYSVLSADGISDDIVIDQVANAGKVVSLGTFTFNSTSPAAVGVTNYGDISNPDLTYTVADAVSFGSGGLGNIDITPPVISNAQVFPYGGTLYIQVTITDPDDEVASGKVYLNGQYYDLQSSGDTYAAKIPYNQGDKLNYYILAKDSHGNMAIWNPTKGYMSIGTFSDDIGASPWAFYSNRYSYLDPSCACNSLNPNNDQFVGDPVNTQNGNMLEQDKLVLIQGRPAVDFHITYNSLGGQLSVFGQNWTHSYNYHLINFKNFLFSITLVQYPDGRTIKFDGDNLSPPAGIYDQLKNTGNGYEFTQKDLTKISFDSNGDITRWEDANGNGINFTFANHSGFTNLSQLTSIKADSGRTINLEYNGDGYVNKISAPEGKILTFNYSNDDLVSFVNPNGDTTTFEYNDHLLTKKISPKGDIMYQNTYDGQRKVVKQIVGTNFTQNFSYSNNQTVVTDAYSKVTTYQYNENKLLTGLTDANGKTLSYEYDDSKNKKSMTDRDGNTTTYEYSNGNNTKETDPLGNSIIRTFDTTFNKVTSEVNKISDHKNTYSYDSKGNLLSITNADGKTSENTYNQHGQLTSTKDFNGNKYEYSYNNEGELENITDPVHNKVSYSYDELGRKASETNPRGIKFSYLYDKNDNLLNIFGPNLYVESYQYDKNDHVIKYIDPKSGTTSFEYDASFNTISKTTPLGFTTQYAYGLMNEKLTETDPLGRSTKFDYDPTFNITGITKAIGTSSEAKSMFGYNGMRKQTSITDPLGHISLIQYDKLYRPTKTIKNYIENGSSSESNITDILEYTPTGLRSKFIDADSNTTTYQFDKLDRVISKTDALNQTTSYEYDNNGNVIKTINPKGYATTFSYDGLNRVIEIVDAKGSTTKHTYDANGNVLTLTDTNGVITKFSYDDFDRMSSKIMNYEENGPTNDNTNVKTTYKYDLKGNLISTTNPKNFTTTFVYDLDGRNTQIIDALGNTVNLSYDKVNNLIQATDKNGNPTKQNFDELNRVVEKINAENFSLKYKYDKNSNLTQITDPKNSATTFEYDGANRLAKTIDALGGITKYNYDPIGNLVSKIDANNHTNAYVYDKVYQQIQNIDEESNSIQTTYDKNGNKATTKDANGNITEFTYDELDRLISTKNPLGGVQSYSYDKLENTLSETDENGHTKNYEYDKQYRLVKVTDAEGHSTKINYDTNGNTVSITDGNDHTITYSYDEIDRLISQTNAENEKTSFTYDKESSRTSKIDPDGVVTGYNYDKIYRLISVIQNKSDKQKDNQTNVTNLYEYDGNKKITRQMLQIYMSMMETIIELQK